MRNIWARMPIDCIGTVSNSALILLSLLLNADDGTHTVTIRRKTMSGLMHCSEDRITILMNELGKAGYIEKREQCQTCVRVTLRADILPPKRQARYAKQAPSAENSSIDMAAVEAMFNNF